MHQHEDPTTPAAAPKPGRFDYVAYDADAQAAQRLLKAGFENVERDIEQHVNAPRYKALAFTYLELAYALVGKAIRDDQIARNGSAPLQEGRGPG